MDVSNVVTQSTMAQIQETRINKITPTGSKCTFKRVMDRCEASSGFTNVSNCLANARVTLFPLTEGGHEKCGETVNTFNEVLDIPRPELLSAYDTEDN